MFTKRPVNKEKTIVKTIYRPKYRIPSTILRAPRLVIFVAGPVSMKEAALPTLMPSHSHCCKSGMVPPPQAYRGMPMVAAINTPSASLPPNSAVITSAGTYRWNSQQENTVRSL